MTGRKNGNHSLAVLEEEEPMIARRLYERLKDRLLDAEDDVKRLQRTKSQIEETLWAERQMFALEKERWGRRIFGSLYSSSQ